MDHKRQAWGLVASVAFGLVAWAIDTMIAQGRLPYNHLTEFFLWGSASVGAAVGLIALVAFVLPDEKLRSAEALIGRHRRLVSVAFTLACVVPPSIAAARFVPVVLEVHDSIGAVIWQIRPLAGEENQIVVRAHLQDSGLVCTIRSTNTAFDPGDVESVQPVVASIFAKVLLVNASDMPLTDVRIRLNHYSDLESSLRVVGAEYDTISDARGEISTEIVMIPVLRRGQRVVITHAAYFDSDQFWRHRQSDDVFFWRSTGRASAESELGEAKVRVRESPLLEIIADESLVIGAMPAAGMEAIMGDLMEQRLFTLADGTGPLDSVVLRDAIEGNPQDLRLCEW